MRASCNIDFGVAIYMGEGGVGILICGYGGGGMGGKWIECQIVIMMII